VPTVLRQSGFRFFFFSNEGTEPAHVHVESGDGYAKYWLDPVSLAVSKDLKSADLKRAKLLVIEHRLVFQEKWREYFGT
jgi:hypothetical protein